VIRAAEEGRPLCKQAFLGSAVTIVIAGYRALGWWASAKYHFHLPCFGLRPQFAQALNRLRVDGFVNNFPLLAGNRKFITEERYLAHINSDQTGRPILDLYIHDAAQCLDSKVL